MTATLSPPRVKLIVDVPRVVAVAVSWLQRTAAAPGTADFLGGMIDAIPDEALSPRTRGDLAEFIDAALAKIAGVEIGAAPLVHPEWWHQSRAYLRDLR